MSFDATLAFIAGLLSFAIGVTAVIRKRRSPAAWCFFGGMSVLAVESAFGGMSLEATGIKEFAFWLTLTLTAGSALPGIWLCFSLIYSRGNHRDFVRRWRWPLVFAFLAPLGVGVGFHGDLVHISYPDLMGNPAKIWFGGSAKVLNILLLVATVLILVNLEKTFRAAVGTTRWRVKFLFLGLAVVFGAQIYTLSQALLYSTYNPALVTVKSVALLITSILIFVAYLRSGFAELDLYPSRDILYRSVTLLLAGGYLFIVGVLAKVVSYLGGSRSLPAQAFIILLGIVGLAVLLLSDRTRNKLRAFISRHFKRPQHDFRRIWTLSSRRVSSVADRTALCTEAAKLISETFEVLSVTILLVEDDKKSFVVGACTNREAAAEGERAAGRLAVPAMQAGLKDLGCVIKLEKIKADWAERLREVRPSQFEHGGERVCLPLRSGERLLGIIVLADRVNGVAYTHEELDLLGCVGDQVAAGLFNLRLTEELLRARELEAFQTMSTFFVHDMKNAASSLNIMLQNLPGHMDDPAFRKDALRAISKTAGRIDHLIGRLNTFRQKLEAEPVATKLDELVEETLNELEPMAEFELVKELKPVPMIPLDREQIRNVVTNLVFNARAAVGNDGRVRVETGEENGAVVLAIEDDGCGMSPEFMRDSLFRPFQTTKKEGLGIGMFQSKMIVEAHDGNIEVESKPKKGTTIRVSFPA